MKLIRDKVTGIAAAAAVLLAAGGYFLAIVPQQDATLERQEALEGQEQTNATMQTQIPTLKARLEGISSQVDTLRSLSQRVPAQIGQATLINQLGGLAAASGISEVTNVTVSVPQMVQSQEPAAPAPVDNDDLNEAADEDPTAGAGDAPAAGGQAGAVLASYDISMTVRGSTDSVLAFLQGLRTAPRINVVSSSSYSADEDAVTLTVNTKMFLQQVDVDGLAQQIEELARVTAGSPDQPAAPDDVESPAPTPASEE